MSFIRPEALAALTRAREALAAMAGLAGSVWIFTRGGWLLQGIGVICGLAALALFVQSLQRLRFSKGQADGPGLVEIDEGQVAWYGPGIGGVVALGDTLSLGLITVQGIRVWRFQQSDGQVLFVPIKARGADQLFDALALLPGLETSRLLGAIEQDADFPFLWRRHSPTLLPRNP